MARRKKAKQSAPAEPPQPVTGGNQINATRHATIFDPARFGDRQVDIVGCGATGSRIALELAKMGVQNLHLYDFDDIESHNLANQVFGLEDVGRPKVDALADRIYADTGLVVTKHNEAVTGRTQLGNIVFLLTDTMASRKEIWSGAIRHKLHVALMIETRMGADQGRVYTVDPTSFMDVKFWEENLYEDREAPESLCGSRVTVGPTAALIQSHALWAFIRWFRWNNHPAKYERPEIESLVYADPPMAMNQDVPSVESLI